MRAFVLILIAALLLLAPTACAPTLGAAAKQTVEQPSLSNTDQQTWTQYYHHQFEKYRGNVLAPKESYPDAARTAYQETKVAWDNAIGKAKFKNQLIGLAGGVVATGVGVVAGLLLYY